MDQSDHHLRAIFVEALERNDPIDRAGYLDRACGDDLELRRQIEELIISYAEAGDFFKAEPHQVSDPAAPREAGTATSEGLLKEGPGTMVGRFRLLEKIGEGGFGVVYMAEQKAPVRRRVALKIIKVGMDTKEVVGRFESERQALALMDHPNIAKIFDGGATDTGRPYFVMELVMGVTITQYCQEARLTTTERLELFIAVCRAIQHAHQKGIIHRDIKPSNVMVTLHDGTPIPKVIDFGIAKATQQPLTEKTVFTRFAHMLGTPAYMSPEQTEMSGLDLDTRSDVYSLGALLYELLTDVAPFDTKELMESGLEVMRRIICEREPLRPSTRIDQNLRKSTPSSTAPAEHHSELASDLDWISMKCLEKDRSRRYETANELATDIQRHLNNEPILAVAPTMVYQLQKFYLKHRTVMRTIAGAAIMLALITAISVWLAIRATLAESVAQTAKDQADVERLAAVRAKEKGDQLHYYNSIALADRFIENGSIDRAKELLESCLPRYRNWEWGRLMSLCHQEMLTLNPFGRGAPILSISADNRLLCAQRRTEVPTLKVFDIQTGKELYSHGTESDPVSGWSRFSPSENLILVARGEYLQMLNGETGQVLYVVAEESIRASFSPDGTRFVSVNRAEDKARVYDTKTGELLLTLNGAPRSVQDAGFSPDGERVISQGGLGEYDPTTIHVWDSQTGEELFNLKPDLANHREIWISPQGTYYLSRDKNGQIDVWNAQTQAFIHTIPVLAEHSIFSEDRVPLYVLGWSEDDRLLIGSQDEAINVWDPRTGSMQYRLSSRPGLFRSNSQAGITATLPRKKIVKLWDSETGRLVRELKGHSQIVEDFIFSPDGSLAASASVDGEVKIWNPSLGRSIGETTDSIYQGAYSPAGDTIVTAQKSGMVSVFDAASGRKRFEFKAHLNSAHSVAFSPDGSWFVTGGTDHMARIWDSKTAQLRRTLKGHEYGILSVTVSPDGHHIATGGFDRRAILWDAAKGRRKMDFKSQTSVKCLTFNPSGDSLATGNNLGSVIIWDIESGRKRKTLVSGHQHHVHGLDFNTQGDRLVAAGSDATIRIWDVESGKLLQSIPSRQQLQDVRFSHDGLRLFSSTSYGGASLGYPTVDVWDLETGRELLALRGHATSLFSIAVHPSGRNIASFSFDRTFRQWECFPWRESEYPGDESLPLKDRIRQFASQYRQERYSLESAAVPIEAARIETRFDDVFPERDERLPPRLVNLAPWYNGPLDAMWLGVQRTRVFGDDLTALPQGPQWLNNVYFDVRGVIQLANNNRFFQRYFTNAVNGIQVNQKASHLHFLHASDGWEDDGTKIGSYVIHYTNGTTEELEIIYGEDLRNWWYGLRRFKPFRKEPFGADDAALAWQGSNLEVQIHSPNKKLRLFQKTYVNPKPDLKMTHIDFKSTLTRAAPFLIAMTVTDEAFPSIISQPESTAILLGQDVSFSAEGEGELPFQYQWFQDGISIQNATNATLKLPKVTAAQVGSYQVAIEQSGPDSLLRRLSRPAYLGISDATHTYGRVKADSFLNVHGEGLVTLTNHVRYPEGPDDVDFLYELEYLKDRETFQDHFGAKISGYITPPISGEYRFYFSSDDQGALYLSSDGNSPNLELIAHEPEASFAQRNWVGRQGRPNRENVSRSLSLRAGENYYFEALMVDASGGHHLGVAWQLPGESEPKNGDPPISGKYLSIPNSWVVPN